MIGGVQVVGARQVAAEMLQAGPATQRRIDRVVKRNAIGLVTRVRARASGRPGPRAITGDYRRSWTANAYRAGGSAYAVVGTNKPQARRLEYGFFGADSRGRVYQQRPYPHAGPAFDEQAVLFTAEVTAVLGTVFK